MKVYLLGGPPRIGKSTIMSKVMKEKAITLVSVDAIQEGVRALFYEDPFQILRDVAFSGEVEYFDRQTKTIQTKAASFKGDEQELARRSVIGFIDHYRRSLQDIDLKESTLPQNGFLL